MSREDKITLAVAGAAIVLVLVMSGMAAEGAYHVQGAVEGVPQHQGYPPGHQHLATPDQIGDVLWGPHPVYTGPHAPGTYRDALIARGWQFLSDPPQDAII